MEADSATPAPARLLTRYVYPDRADMSSRAIKPATDKSGCSESTMAENSSMANNGSRRFIGNARSSSLVTKTYSVVKTATTLAHAKTHDAYLSACSAGNEGAVSATPDDQGSWVRHGEADRLP
jgi:hypothetical protein